MSVSTVQNEQGGGQLIDNQAEIQKNAIALQQTLAAGAGGSGGAAPAATSDTVTVAGEAASKALAGKTGIAGSAFFSALTEISDSAKKPGSDMIFGTGKKKGSRFTQIHDGGISAMPSSYAERKLMAKMAARPDKRKLADRKLAAQINGATSTVAGHSYAHGNSVVMAGGARVPGASVSALSAAPEALAAPVMKKYQDNIIVAANNLIRPSAQRINEGLAQGHADMELLANQETPEQQRLRLGNTSQSFRAMEANQSHDFVVDRNTGGFKAPAAPTPPGQSK
jgi:hypothetical protein